MGYHINTPGRICYAVDDYAEASALAARRYAPGGSANGSTPSAAGVHGASCSLSPPRLRRPNPSP